MPGSGVWVQAGPQLSPESSLAWAGEARGSGDRAGLQVVRTGAQSACRLGGVCDHSPDLGVLFPRLLILVSTGGLATLCIPGGGQSVCLRLPGIP